MDHHRADHHSAPAETRALSEILSDARTLQAGHAPRLFGAAGSWLRDRIAPRASRRSSIVARSLVVH